MGVVKFSVYLNRHVFIMQCPTKNEQTTNAQTTAVEPSVINPIGGGWREAKAIFFDFYFSYAPSLPS